MGAVRILVFDDFEQTRRSICSVLAEDPYLVVVGEGADGLEAVQQCEELQPDLVLLDLLLPKMNGLEAAQRIRDASPGTKILFLSSYHSRELMREELRTGASFVMKADVERDLLTVVRAVVHDKPVVLFTFSDDGLQQPIRPESDYLAEPPRFVRERRRRNCPRSRGFPLRGMSSMSVTSLAPPLRRSRTILRLWKASSSARWATLMMVASGSVEVMSSIMLS